MSDSNSHVGIYRFIRAVGKSASISQGQLCNLRIKNKKKKGKAAVVLPALPTSGGLLSEENPYFLSTLEV